MAIAIDAADDEHRPAGHSRATGYEGTTAKEREARAGERRPVQSGGLEAEGGGEHRGDRGREIERQAARSGHRHNHAGRSAQPPGHGSVETVFHVLHAPAKTMQFLGRDERLFLAEDVADVVRTGFKAFILLVVVSMQREIGFEHDKLQSHEPEPFAIAGPDGPVDLVIQGFSVEEVPVPFNADGLRDPPRPLIKPFPLPLGVPVVFLPFDVVQDLLSHEGMEHAGLATMY